MILFAAINFTLVSIKSFIQELNISLLHMYMKIFTFKFFKFEKNYWGYGNSDSAHRVFQLKTKSNAPYCIHDQK
jgi:hypothetical protein